MDKVEATVNAVLDELHRAQAKFPPFHSAHEGWAVIDEEAEELKREVYWGTRERQFEEAVQVAAMAIRFLLDIPPPAERSE